MMNAGYQYLVRIMALLVPATMGFAQTTNTWILNANGLWSVTNNWFPSNSYPDSVGAVVFITNNITANRILTIDTNATLGALIWGDINRDRQMDLRTNAAGARLTFDTGDDGEMAVLSHATGDVAGRDIGNDSDDADVGITVADAQGLYIDAFRNLVFEGRTSPNAIFDGGGRDVIKGEDGTLYFRRVVTNINTLTVRDGTFRIDPEGRPELLPSIGTVVVGVASGVIDTGEASPLGTITNNNEGSLRDRRQFASFELIGAATTNSATVMTNTFNLVMNRGIFRSYNREGPTNGPPAVYSGNIQLNGDASEVFFQIESVGNYATNSVLRHIFDGNLIGSGGLTKWGNGELVLVNSNSFTGDLNILRANDRRRGNAGGVRLEGQGTLSGVGAISLQRDGSLFVDNSSVNLSNRINDSATITTWGRSQIEFVGNGSGDTYERLGITTVTNGRLAIEFDSDNISPQAHTLDLASLNRARGTIVGFHSSDVLQGAFATNGPGSITVNLLDGGASLLQVGSGGGVGASNRSVVVGVFGGDGVDNGVDPSGRTPDRADEFMTVDGGRLRTLRADEMIYLGGGSTNPLLISQASAGADENVNINFASEYLNFSQYSITNALNQVITKRVVGDATFNSVRLGLVRGETAILGNLTNAPSDLGRSLVMDDGVRLTSESGMLLVGRDTTSANGDVTPGGNVLIYNGVLDLDGAANNREAIIQNDSGNSLFLRTAVEASQGLTKGGQSSVYLDVANRLGGTVNIAQANLYVRNGNALNGAAEVRVNGDGLLILQNGVAVTNDIPLNVSPMPYGNRIILSESGHNLWAGDIRINNVDNQGLVASDMRLGAGLNAQNATLTLLGDIGRVDAGATSDVFMIDSPQVSSIESAGILNLKGTFGDRLDENGNAVPFDPTGTGQSRVEGGSMSNRAANENDVLRFRIDGPSVGTYYGDELVVNIYKPWNAAGRINAEQGTIRFLGDPSQGEGEFWTSNALAVANFANGLSGFVLAGSGTEARGSVTFLLTKDGQAFNAERWSIAQDNAANNTVTMGLEHFGPSNATVTIGNRFDDGGADGADNRITISGENASRIREFRLFSHDGYDSATTNETTGRVNVIQSIVGNDNSMLTKVGSGTVALQGVYTGNTNVYDENNDIRHFTLLGGELILDRSTNGVWDGSLRRTTAGRAALTLAGGDLTHLGRHTTTTELLTSNLTVKAGDSRVSAVAGGGGTTELFVGTGANTIVTRQRGGTVGFVEDRTAGGAANIRLAGSGITVGGRVGSWATYGTNYGGGAYTWAATDSLSNVIEFGEGFYSADAFGSGQHVTLNLPSAFAADDAAASLRYTNAAALDLGGFSLNVEEGGVLVTPAVAGAASIGNGALTSSGGELIIHNYADPLGSLAIAAAITGNVDLTFSGSGKTVLSGANTYTGASRINGGTVQIDDASRLGADGAILEMRGGTLYSTASMFLSNRTVVLGGDGGTFNVAAGTTNILGRLQSESNFLAATRMNNGHGDLIKTGEGTLNLTYSIGDERTQTTNTYQGITDIREGTLRIGASGAFALGTSKSFYDGTVVRSGATLAIGSNTANSAYNIREWLTLEEGSTLRIERQTTAYSSPGVDGVINLVGDATIWVESYEADLNENGGYLMGSGNLIKDGNAPLRLLQYSPEFTGGIVVVDSYLEDYGYAGSVIPNASSITIGLNDTTNRGAVGFMVRGVERNAAATTWDVTQDIFVQGNSTDTRLGVRRAQNNDVVNFTGNISLSNLNSGRDLFLYYERDITQRDANGGDGFRQEAFVNLTGDISGGNKRIRTLIEQVGGPYTGWTQTQERVEGSQILTNEPDFVTFWTFSGSNVDWTGSLEAGNRASTSTATGGPDLDKQHFVRFGNNDGAATFAIGSSNDVILRHDATLQAYGSQVTIGSLFSDPIVGGPQNLVTNTFLENGGTAAGSFTIHQTSNSVFSGVVRDGTYYSPASSNVASAPLSIIKAGSGVLTFDRSNYYTGATTVREGLLQINGSHLGGGLYTVLAGGSLGGTGIIGSAVNVADGGSLAPGMTNSGVGGTLNISADLSLSDNAILSFEMNGFDTTPGSDVNDLMQGIGNLVLDGMLTITPLASFSGMGTNDFWTLLTYSGSLTDNTLVVDGASQGFLDPGLAFFVYNYEGGVIDEIRLGIMVPEPSIWALLVIGGGMVAWRLRRRFWA